MAEALHKSVSLKEKRPPNILVVDDDPVSEFLVGRALRQYGFNVYCATDSAFAIELLEGEVPFDLVFSDVIMSGAMDGLGLARWIVLNRPGLPVMLGSANKTTKIPPGLAGEVTFFPKPYDAKTIVAHIQERLAQ